LYGEFGKVWVLVTTVDDFTAQHLQMIAMAEESFGGEAVLQQVYGEGPKGLQERLADGNVLWIDLPQARPVRPVRAKLIESRCVSWNNCSVVTSPRFGCHAVYPRAQCVLSLPWFCL